MNRRFRNDGLYESYFERVVGGFCTGSRSGGVRNPVVLGGAALGGMVAIDRRTAGTQIEDETIELAVIQPHPRAFGDKVHVNVTSYNRQVLVTGEVGTAEARQEVERIVGGVENVRPW